MALVKDTCPDCIELIEGCKIDVTDEGLEEEEEVFSFSSIDEMIGCYTVEVVHIFPKCKKNFCGLPVGNIWYVPGRLTYLDDVFKIG